MSWPRMEEKGCSLARSGGTMLGDHLVSGSNIRFDFVYEQPVFKMGSLPS